MSMSDPIAEEEALGKAYDTRLLIRLWPYIAPYRRQVILTLALVVPMFVLELAPAWIVKVGMDRIFPPAGVAVVTGEGGALSWLLDAPASIPPLWWLGGGRRPPSVLVCIR